MRCAQAPLSNLGGSRERGAEVGDRPVARAGPLVQQAALGVGARILLVEVDGGGEVADGVVGLLQVDQDQRAVVVGGHELRVEPDQVIEVGEGGLVALQRTVGVAAAVAGGGMIGREAERLVVVAQRILVAAQALVRPAPAEMQRGVAALEADGPGVVGKRLLVLLVLGVGAGPLLQRGDVVGLGLEGAGRLGDLAIGGRIGGGLLLGLRGRLRGCGLRCGAAGVAQRAPVLLRQGGRGGIARLRAHHGDALGGGRMGADDLEPVGHRAVGLAALGSGLGGRGAAVGAFEEIAEALRGDAGTLEQAHGMLVGLALGHARVAQVREQHAQIGDGARRAREDELRGGGIAHGADQAGLGMQLDGVAELVGQHAGHLVGGARRIDEPARQDDLPARHGKAVDQVPVEHHDADRHALLGRRRGQTLGELVEGRAARRRLAGLAVAGDAADDLAPDRLARLLGHDARHGLGRMQLEPPGGQADGEQGRDGGKRRPRGAPALARGGERRHLAQQLGGEGGIGTNSV